MHLFFNTEHGPQIFNEMTDITSVRSSNRGYILKGVTSDNTGDNLLSAMNIKIDELKSAKLIADNYQITSVVCEQGLGNGANFLPYLIDEIYSTMTLSNFFTNGREHDRIVYVNVYLDKTTDAQAKKKDGGKRSKRSKKRRRSRKRL